MSGEDRTCEALTPRPPCPGPSRAQARAWPPRPPGDTARGSALILLPACVGGPGGHMRESATGQAPRPCASVAVHRERIVLCVN